MLCRITTVGVDFFREQVYREYFNIRNLNDWLIFIWLKSMNRLNNNTEKWLIQQDLEGHECLY